jgi:hypothetical protein
VLRREFLDQPECIAQFGVEAVQTLLGFRNGGRMNRECKPKLRLRVKAKELKASTTSLLHSWELSVQQMLLLGAQGTRPDFTR